MKYVIGTLVLCLGLLSGCQTIELADAEIDLRRAMDLANKSVLEAEQAGIDSTRTDAEINRIKMELIKVSEQAQKSGEELNKAIIKVKATYAETAKERMRRDRAFASAERALAMLKQTVFEIDQKKTSEMSEALAELKIEKRSLDEAFIRAERLRMQFSIVNEEAGKAKERLLKALTKMKIAMGDLGRAKDRWEEIKGDE